jgi:protein-S-isoprenylcysteine O-methyltransferase Ste14
MYVGVIGILLGESMFFWSRPLLVYSLIMFTLFNVIVIGYEEHRLRSKYGDEYRRYCAAVGRWLPGKEYR